MKNLTPIIMIALAMFFSCKTIKKGIVEEPIVQTPVENVVIPEPVIEPEKPAPVKEEKPVFARSESVVVAKNEDKSLGRFEFYVIAGSFSKPENANNFKKQIQEKGFTSVVLSSESGLYRVAIEQTNSEYDARVFISKMRQVFPEHSGVWLLRKR